MADESISVIIPAFNAVKYICESIDSVLAQTFPPKEVIIVDDGSDDETGSSIQSRYAHRVRYYYQSNQGESAARNAGIQLATAEWVAFLDADDLWHPQKLELQVRSMQSVPVDGCSCNILKRRGEPAVRFSTETYSIYDNALAAMLAGQAYMNSDTVILNRSKVLQMGGFDSDLRTGPDLDLWARYFAAFPKLAFCHAPLAYYRDNPHSVRYSTSRKSQIADSIAMLNKHRALPSTGTPDYRIPFLLYRRLATLIGVASKSELQALKRALSDTGSSRRLMVVSILSKMPHSCIRFLTSILAIQGWLERMLARRQERIEQWMRRDYAN